LLFCQAALFMMVTNVFFDGYRWAKEEMGGTFD
jgi:hypothetical protein